MGGVGVTLDKVALLNFRLFGGPLQAKCKVELSLGLIVHLLQEGNCVFFLGKNPAGSYLSNVRGCKIYPVLETVLKLRKIDPLGVYRSHHLIQLLLRSDRNPDRSDCLFCFESVLANLSELLDEGSKIFDPISASGNILANLVDYEDQRLARPSFLHEIKRPLDNILNGQGIPRMR